MILGTAGHIDHGKTALVRALTGVDTDRLKEEKARGITIELGFARLSVGDRRFGVVDVPGHEAFVRAMVAGAAGMDVVLLVVAADEGVMPQTREHLAIVELLDVTEIVVAITKCDAVEEEWLELVEADVAELLKGTRYASARTVRTSSLQGTGLEELLRALEEAADRVGAPRIDDLARLPLDRVFTIQGTGTVATGTLWSGQLRVGDRVRVLPQNLEGRVRGLQVHDEDVQTAGAGERTAVALVGDGADRSAIGRGATLVTSADWEPTWMLTARVKLVPGTEWTLAHNQRVHVHHGTAEILARCALLEDRELTAGASGWVQLRLEEPLAARARDRLVLRSYSPVTTIGGGVIAEALPPKRNRLEDPIRSLLDRVVDGTDLEALSAHVELQGWQGAPLSGLAVQSGIAPVSIEALLPTLEESGFLGAALRVYAPEIRAEAERKVLEVVIAAHASDPVRASAPLASVRGALPQWVPEDLTDAVVGGLLRVGELEAVDGGVRRPGHRPTLSEEQQAASSRLEELLVNGGLGAPAVDELPEDLRGRADLWSLVHRLEGLGLLRQVGDGLYLPSAELDTAAERIASRLGGRTGLGPSEFREVLPVSRKRLIPLLNYFDGLGATLRRGELRDVPGPP